MFVSVITDCHDANASIRQTTRFASLLNCPVNLVGVHTYNEIEAAAHLIDCLDAAIGEPGIIVANVAPRHGKGKNWPNGTPFAYFHYHNTLVISTIDGYTLSLVKKLNLTNHVNVFDLPTVVNTMVQQGHLNPNLSQHIIKTQFRSFEFVPRVTFWLHQGMELPTKRYSMDQVPDLPAVVTFSDNFGNCPTSILPKDIGFEAGKTIDTKIGSLTCFERLKDVPNDQPGLVIGSWGLKDKRFLAVMIQGKSAAKHFNLQPGSEIL